MTENNESIWKDNDPSPIMDGFIIPDDLSIKGVKIVDKRNGIRWCYLDDLLAQSTESESLKSENDRLKKALDIALENLDIIANGKFREGFEGGALIMKKVRAEMAIRQIKEITAELEPKGN